MNRNYSNNFREIIQRAKNTVNDDKLIQPKNLLAAIAYTEHCKGFKVMQKLNVNIDSIKNKVFYDPNELSLEELKITEISNNIINQSHIESQHLNNNYIGSEHLLLSLIRSGILKVDLNKAKQVVQNIQNQSDNDPIMGQQPIGNEQNTQNKSKSLIKKFCTNLNELAKKGELDPIIGRDKEVKRLEQILSRRKKNNPVIIGEAGVGKTALAEGLAQKIIKGEVNENLLDKQIYTLEMNNIVAGTKFRGEFEERMKNIIKEIKEEGNVIIYIDELHSLVGAGSAQGALDAANILKPALSKGEINCIGSTTNEEYREIEKDKALDRRFQKLILSEPSYMDTKKIIHTLKERYEDHHNVKYPDNIIDLFLKLSSRYLHDRNFPDKAIDLMDEVGSYVKINNSTDEEIIQLNQQLKQLEEQKLDFVKKQKFEEAANKKQEEDELKKKVEKTIKSKKEKKEKVKVTSNDVLYVISNMTNIPSSNLSEDEMDRFVNLDKDIKKELIGQDEAVDKVYKAVLRNKADINNEKKPLGTFLFIGKTGVGKTYLTKLLAKNIFNSEDDIIRLDMSEYMEENSVSKMIGAAPGYVGYEEAGQLTEKVRRNPYSIILLDEIEKAHQDVINILLQVLDDGIMTDSQGRTVDFRNSMIIMTSNIGTKKVQKLKQSIGYGNASQKTDNQNKTSEIIQKEVKDYFTPEFLNRIDQIVLFNPLGKDIIEEIVDIELNKFKEKLVNNKDITIVFDESVKEFIFEDGWDEHMGARPIKRAIQNHLEDEIAFKIVTKDIKEGDTVFIKKKDNEDEMSFEVTDNDYNKVDENNTLNV